jgi:Flp pilus assembly protein TadG
MSKTSFRRKQEHGAVAIIVALSIAVLVGFTGLALYAGQLFVSKTELQNAADSCALSASAALTGTNSNQLVIAENWGKKAGQANRVGFQKIGVTVESSDVKFSETLQGSYHPANDIAASDILKMKYAKCTLARTGIKTWFIQVLNVLPGVAIGDQAVASMGAATLLPSQTTCALPVAICMAKVNTIQLGDWIEAVVGAQESITGDFKWVNYIGSNSKKEIKNILTEAGVCDLSTVDEKVGTPGSSNGVTDAWNSRFGIYPHGVYTGPTAGVPDYTGYGYTEKNWPHKKKAYDGPPPPPPPGVTALPNFKSARSLNKQFNEAESGPALNGIDKPISVDDHKKYGSERRLGIVPVVDCDEFAEAGNKGASIKNFACVLMLHPLKQGGGPDGPPRMSLEYLGPANSLASPCSSAGVPGNSTSVGPLVPALVQ